MSEPEIIRVVAVDDHEVVRSGLRFSLMAFDDIELVGEAGTGEEALRVCREVRPDVVLMDLRMPGMGGVEATKALLLEHPEVKVIALTSFQERTYVQGALKAGAIGYLLKDIGADELAQAIRAAHAGQATLSPEAAKALAEAVVAESGVGHDLTARELQVLALLVEGLSNAAIAQQLRISHHTARFHVSTILSKLCAANRAEAAALAVKHHLLE
ncbi:MAG TPA: response regulator transcription factor [Anaerolineae bacterium]|nr:response regulator transcription factor [Anaerolineae bacterium]